MVASVVPVFAFWDKSPKSGSGPLQIQKYSEKKSQKSCENQQDELQFSCQNTSRESTLQHHGEKTRPRLKTGETTEDSTLTAAVVLELGAVWNKGGALDSERASITCRVV